MISLASVFHPISKETSLYIKGGAIFLMLLAHIVPESHIEFHSINFFTGISCLAFYAFVSGYAQALIADKNRDRKTLQIAGKCYWSFYIYYIICCAVIIPIYLIRGRISASNIPFIIIPIYCAWPIDPWWYAFCYGVFCFVVFPILHWFEKIISNKYFIIILFLSILATILLPISFRQPLFPNDFRQMWNSIPILRTTMIIPYYMMGFGYYKYIQNPEKNSSLLTLLVISLLIFTSFPFSSYGINRISDINIGFSFILCSIILCILHRNEKVRGFLAFLGTHSTFMWLLHMPINSCYNQILIHYIPFSVSNFHAVSFLIVFSLSLSVSMLISHIRKKINVIFTK